MDAVPRDAGPETPEHRTAGTSRCRRIRTCAPGADRADAYEAAFSAVMSSTPVSMVGSSVSPLMSLMRLSTPK